MAHVGEKVEEPTDAFCVADAQQWLAWRHATLRHLAADGGGHAICWRTDEVDRPDEEPI